MLLHERDHVLHKSFIIITIILACGTFLLKEINLTFCNSFFAFCFFFYVSPFSGKFQSDPKMHAQCHPFWKNNCYAVSYVTFLQFMNQELVYLSDGFLPRFGQFYPWVNY